ncbi:CPBP family intramembrane glutamic endopeptidase [Hymenobacter cellulosivorans]|uniref:CPBP family intramembrane metalloprotease n=1 Tax=Hymenobacter cellulosivorans TaxID=2932249 RepID=A0ABY4FE40_9BACT|nr:CPBP family intramembrane glutamic endopeptidase [Hymenobacter cellulosivorans]UOQ54242.1 CPBP family intramembrane metalloprotease [Hymenobacter cellulosivorans]
MILIGLALVFLSVGALVASVLTKLFFGIGLLEMGDAAQNPQNYPNSWGAIMLSQGVTLVFGLAGAALALVWLTGRSWREYLMPRRSVSAVWFVAAAAIVILALPLMAYLIEWNSQAHVPKFLEGSWLTRFGTWALAKEEELKKTTAFMTRFSSPGRFGVAVLVIAAGAAIGEELFFRGVLQRNLVEWFRSRHVGVFVAAAIFSAIHMQFLGFVPRFVLGLILGYLYEWSGNILVPMTAHFTQNAFQLLLVYVQQQQWTASAFDPDSTDSIPWYLVLLSVLFVGAILYFLHQRSQQGPAEMHTLSAGGVAVASPETAPAETRTLGSKGIEADRK